MGSFILDPITPPWTSFLPYPSRRSWSPEGGGLIRSFRVVFLEWKHTNTWSMPLHQATCLISLNCINIPCLLDLHCYMLIIRVGTLPICLSLPDPQLIMFGMPGCRTTSGNKVRHCLTLMPDGPACRTRGPAYQASSPPHSTRGSSMPDQEIRQCRTSSK